MTRTKSSEISPGFAFLMGASVSSGLNRVYERALKVYLRSSQGVKADDPAELEARIALADAMARRLASSPLSEETVWASLLRAGASMELARAGHGDPRERIESAMQATDKALADAEALDRDDLRREARLMRARARRSLAELEPARKRVLLGDALMDLGIVISFADDPSGPNLARVQMERADVLREVAAAEGIATNERTEEVLDAYRGALDQAMEHLDHTVAPTPVPAQSASESAQPETSWREQMLALRNSFDLSRAALAPLLGYSERMVAAWENGEKQPSSEVVRRYQELRRLHEGLSSVMQPGFVPTWLKARNPAFDNEAPLDLIRDGRSDLLWQAIFQLRSSPSW